MFWQFLKYYIVLILHIIVALLFVSLIVCPGYLAAVYSKTFIAGKLDIESLCKS